MKPKKEKGSKQKKARCFFDLFFFSRCIEPFRIGEAIPTKKRQEKKKSSCSSKKKKLRTKKKCCSGNENNRKKRHNAKRKGNEIKTLEAGIRYVQ